MQNLYEDKWELKRKNDKWTGNNSLTQLKSTTTQFLLLIFTYIMLHYFAYHSLLRSIDSPKNEHFFSERIKRIYIEAFLIYIKFFYYNHIIKSRAACVKLFLIKTIANRNNLWHSKFDHWSFNFKYVLFPSYVYGKFNEIKRRKQNVNEK